MRRTGLACFFCGVAWGSVPPGLSESEPSIPHEFSASLYLPVIQASGPHYWSVADHAPAVARAVLGNSNETDYSMIVDELTRLVRTHQALFLGRSPFYLTIRRDASIPDVHEALVQVFNAHPVRV